MIRKLLLAASILAATPTAFAQPTAIVGGRVVTNTSQGVIENATVVINNGRIVSVNTAAPPAGATVVDAKGKWVTPGLFAAFSRIGLAELDSEDPTNNVSAGGSDFPISLRAADSFDLSLRLYNPTPDALADETTIPFPTLTRLSCEGDER